MAKKPHGNSTHGMCKSRTYHSWTAIFARCYNQKYSEYHLYGGRGIWVCDYWNKFENFLADMGVCPEGMSIERTDNNLGYFKGNCKWATPSEQSRNRRSNRFLTINGETMCAKDWSKKSGLKYQTVMRRLDQGVPAEKAVFAALQEGRRFG